MDISDDKMNVYKDLARKCESFEFLKNNEPGGESSLRNYVESQIIGAQINRERYQSENNFVTESVTDDMTYEPDIEQTTGMRI